MNIEENVMENKAKLRMLEFRVHALITLLTKEGVVLEEEVEQELRKLMHDDS